MPSYKYMKDKAKLSRMLRIEGKHRKQEVYQKKEAAFKLT